MPIGTSLRMVSLKAVQFLCEVWRPSRRVECPLTIRLNSIFYCPTPYVYEIWDTSLLNLVRSLFHVAPQPFPIFLEDNFYPFPRCPPGIRIKQRLYRRAY